MCVGNFFIIAIDYLILVYSIYMVVKLHVLMSVCRFLWLQVNRDMHNSVIWFRHICTANLIIEFSTASSSRTGRRVHQQHTPQEDTGSQKGERNTCTEL